MELNLKNEISKINDIINRDYDCEVPDSIRSKKFHQAFTRLMKKMFPDYEIITKHAPYCESSGFIKNRDGNFIYYSTCDYRFPLYGRDWTSGILIRTAENSNDYHGGSNHTTNLENLYKDVNDLFAFTERKRYNAATRTLNLER